MSVAIEAASVGRGDKLGRNEVHALRTPALVHVFGDWFGVRHGNALHAVCLVWAFEHYYDVCVVLFLAKDGEVLGGRYKEHALYNVFRRLDCLFRFALSVDVDVNVCTANCLGLCS